MSAVVVDPTRDPGWDQQVATHPFATVFHGSAWARVLTSTYGLCPVYLRCTMGDQLVALVPLMEHRRLFQVRRGISLPFSDFCDILIFDHAYEDEVFELIRSVSQQRGWQYFELRGQSGVPPHASPAVSFYSHQLDLRGGYQEVVTNFRPSVRQALRKVERGLRLTATLDRSEQGMRHFFALHALTRRRHGLPPQPKGFFFNIHKEIIEPKNGFIVVVRLGSEVVSSMVFFYSGKIAIYKFGASDKSLQSLRPNNLAMATAIQALTGLGLDTLHFGRSSLLNDGLRRFKLSWGAHEGKLHYYRYHPRTSEWSVTRDRSSGRHTELFRRLPLAVNKLAGALLYPYLD